MKKLDSKQKELLMKLLLPRKHQLITSSHTISIAFQIEAFRNKLLGKESIVAYKKFLAANEKVLKQYKDPDIHHLRNLYHDLGDIDDEEKQNKKIEEITEIRYRIIDRIDSTETTPQIVAETYSDILSLRSNNPLEWPHHNNFTNT